DQVAGVDHRVLVLDGRVLGAVRKDPPVVEGDGHASVAELVLAANDARLAAGGGLALRLLEIDLECALTLAAQGRSLTSVPAAGERVIVKTAVNQNAAADNHTVEVGAADAALARRAAAALGLRLAGVDLVVGPARTVVLEVNGTPGLNHHVMVADPPSAPD